MYGIRPPPSSVAFAVGCHAATTASAPRRAGGRTAACCRRPGRSPALHAAPWSVRRLLRHAARRRARTATSSTNPGSPRHQSSQDAASPVQSGCCTLGMMYTAEAVLHTVARSGSVQARATTSRSPSPSAAPRRRTPARVCASAPAPSPEGGARPRPRTNVGVRDRPQPERHGGVVGPGAQPDHAGRVRLRAPDLEGVARAARAGQDQVCDRPPARPLRAAPCQHARPRARAPRPGTGDADQRRNRRPGPAARGCARPARGTSLASR